MSVRASGVLFHISSLPSRFGIGDMGPWAYKFADFLKETRQGYWQIIPLTPPHPEHYSPYHSPSAFAGNPLLISPELLVEEGLLEASDLDNAPEFPEDRVDFPAVIEYKGSVLERAYQRFRDLPENSEFERFCHCNSDWLDDFALFSALSYQFPGQKWNQWPEALRDREPEALSKAAADLRGPVEKEKFVQYIFFRQWVALKACCNQRGVKIVGDLPIYVDYHNADVWAHPQFFKLDGDRKPYVVAGVPPDYFSATGQLWGHPVYDWDNLRNDDYSWWMDRIRHNMSLQDLCRIDHFRGFVGYWEVPAGEPTAINGVWVDGPGQRFFKSVLRRFPALPIIAEDLGVITPDVREVMAEFDFPGMKVLLFAFGEDFASNAYIPHNIPRNSVVYTGTHDNNTVRGWFDNEATPDDIKRLSAYAGRDIDASNVCMEMCRLAMISRADTAILPMQDILGLGQEARMNLPSQKPGNWMWRMAPSMLTSQVARRLRDMTLVYGRA